MQAPKIGTDLQGWDFAERIDGQELRGALLIFVQEYLFFIHR